DDCRPRRPEARSRLHLRVHGGPQAGRVRGDADLQGSLARRLGAGSGKSDDGEVMANGQATREARASVKHARIAPNKVRFLLNQIRVLDVEDARGVLSFSLTS